MGGWGEGRDSKKHRKQLRVLDLHAFDFAYAAGGEGAGDRYYF